MNNLSVKIVNRNIKNNHFETFLKRGEFYYYYCCCCDCFWLDVLLSFMRGLELSLEDIDLKWDLYSEWVRCFYYECKLLLLWIIALVN